jgi:uridine kinase
MLGDVLLISEKHEAAAREILPYILEKRKDKYTIAVSGESGSGKSELAHVIARLLRKERIVCKPIHIDNYYLTHPLERTEWRKKNGIETAVGYTEYDWDTIYRNLEDFRNNRTSTMPCVDLVTEQVDQLTTDFNGVEMLVIDGLYAIKTEGVDLKIFIELTYHETKKAQVVRGKEPQNEYRMRVLEREHQVVQSLKDRADLLIDMDYKVRKARQ